MGGSLPDATLDSGEPAIETDRVGYRQVALWLTDDEVDTMVEAMRDALAAHIDNEPGPGRRRRLLTTILMPDDRA